MGKVEEMHEKIGEFIKTYQGKNSARAIAQAMVDEGIYESGRYRTLRRRVAEYLHDPNARIEVDYVDEEENKNPGEQPNWVATEDDVDYYYIKSKFGRMKFPVSLIDKIFYKYSKYGEDLSQEDVQLAFNIKVHEWHAIKNSLRLYKGSDIVSPYTKENTPPEELEDLIHDKIHQLVTNKGLVKREYDKVIGREFKKAIKERNMKQIEILAFMNELSEDHVVLTEEVKFKIAKNTTTGHITVVIADLHIGAEVEEMSRTPRFGFHELKEMIDQIIHHVNMIGARSVDVVFLGDLIETFTGTNHPNSWQGIRKGMWGARVVKAAVAHIKYIMSGIINFRKAYFVPGNHDRSTSSNKEDVNGEIAYIITHWLSDVLGEDRVENIGDIGAFMCSDINVIASHGHLNLSKQAASTMAWKYGKQGIFNIIIQGHLHSRQVAKNDDGLDFRKYTIPSVFSGNRYSDQGGWDGGAGFVIIESLGGLPKVTDYTLV
jgi:predicted phosphodiesterase